MGGKRVAVSPSVTWIKFPDGDTQYRVTEKTCAVGETLRHDGYDWVVTDVESAGEALFVAVVLGGCGDGTSRPD
jgi:hypothetical protein